MSRSVRGLGFRVSGGVAHEQLADTGRHLLGGLESHPYAQVRLHAAEAAGEVLHVVAPG